MISIIPYSSSMKGDWDRFLEESKNATFLFRRGFMEYHRDRFIDHSLMIYDDETLVSLFPANKRSSDTIASHDGLTYGGLLVKKGEYSTNAIFYLASLLKYLNEKGIRKMLFKQIPSFYCHVSSEEIDYALALADARVERVDLVSAIELSSPDRIKYQRRRKAGIKKALEHNVSVSESDDFARFWNEILIPNLGGRHGVKPVHSLQEIQKLCQDNPGKIRQFCAFFEGRVMAGCTVFETDNVAHLQYFSGCDEGRGNGALDLLVHHLLTEVFQDKPIVDFGNSNSEGWRKVNKGLLDWKEGFGARSFAQRFFEVETSHYSLIQEAIS